MKRILVLTAAITSAITIAGSALAVGGPLRSASEVTVLTSSNSIQNPKVFQLSNNSSLITWQEETDGKYFLKAKTVSATNKVSSVKTINSEAAINLDWGAGTENSVAISSTGKVFAIWITQGLRYGVQSQKIWGSTTTDGINWSKPFVVVPGLTVSGDAMDCERDLTRSPGCGYANIQVAVDAKGRLAVMTLDYQESTGIRYRVKATNLKGNWTNFGTLAKVTDTRSSQLLGLSSGFAATATSYTSENNNAVRTKFYNPALDGWTKSYTATTTSQNDVYRSQWIQRDSKNLTLLIAAEAGGLSYRNFSLANYAWTGNLVQSQVAENNHVYQNQLATKVGSDLVVIYRDYDRDADATRVKALRISGSTLTTTVLEDSADSAAFLYAGSTSTNAPLIAYGLGQTGVKLGGITEASAPQLITASFDPATIVKLTMTKGDLVLALASIQQGDKTRLVLLKGIAN